jgi:Cu-Zn family superoxide dismutase
MAADPPYARQFALLGASGQALGTVSAWETAGAVGMRIQASGLPHALHGIHVHAVGRCDPPGFTSAGDHWNPTARKHGLNSPEGSHAGDLPNLSVAANGVGSEAMVLSGASLAGLADADGSALVIHATADDHVTDPSGNSGARIACAIISPARM